MCINEKIASFDRAIFFIILWRCIYIKDYLINEQIRFALVKVIDENGEQLDKMKIEDAINLAYSKNLDLVLVSNNEQNPVCKILDYSKFKFEMSKKAKEAKKKQKTVEIKEIRLSPKIDKHDLEVKANMLNKFIASGNKVKVSMKFRGRELNFIEQGKEVMNMFREMISDCQIDKEAKMEGKNLVMFLAPKQK